MSRLRVPRVLLLILLAACGGEGAADPSPSGGAAPKGTDQTSAGGEDRLGFGPAAPIVGAAVGLVGPRTLAIAGGDLVVGLFEAKQIVAVPKLGGPPRILVEGGSSMPALDLFAATTEVVWMRNAQGYDALWSAPIAGGAPRKFDGIPANAPISVRATEDPSSYYVAYQYFAQAGVARMQKSPAQWFAVATREQSTFSSIAADGLRVYVGAQDGIHSVSIAGGTFEPFALGQPAATDLATDATHVYWLTSDGRVARLAKDKAGGAPEVLASGQPALARMVLDGANVHFTLGGGAAGEGALRSVPKAGGPVRELATGLRGPAGLAVDATGLYVAVHDDGTLLRLPR